jgi:hypothetical protein
LTQNIDSRIAQRPMFTSSSPSYPEYVGTSRSSYGVGELYLTSDSGVYLDIPPHSTYLATYLQRL